MSRRYGVSAMPLVEPYLAAKEFFLSTPGADGTWITRALMPSVAIIESLEQELCAPVVTSMQAMMWAGLGLASVKAEVTGCGRWFDHAYLGTPTR